MCKYCEKEDYVNDNGRRFGQSFEKEIPYEADVCISWLVENGKGISYEIYMNDDSCGCDVSVPIKFCPMCGRKLS